MASSFVLFGELKANTSQFQKELRESEARLKQTGKAIDEQARAATNLGKTTATTARGYEKLADAVHHAQSRLNTTAAAFHKGTATASQMRAALLATESATARLNSRLQDNAARLADSTQRKTSFVAKLGAAVGAANLAATAITVLTSNLADGARAVLDYSARMEQTKVGFTTLMGSAQAAQKHLDELKKFALSTPFEFAGLADASRRFQGVGVEASRVIPIMRDIGNAAAAAGASSEQLDRITVAFTQIIAKGKLSAEEVNQLAEHGIPAWQILEKQLKRSKAEIIKLAEQGAISSDVFLTAFQNFSQMNFGDAMQQQSRTFSGAMSNIKDILFQTAGTAFEPLFEKVRDLAVRFADDIQAQGNDFKAVGNVIAQYIGEGLGLGLGVVIESAGKYIGDRLRGIFTEGKIVDPLTSSIFGGLLSGLGFKTLGEDVKKILNPALQQTQSALTKVGQTTKDIPSIANKLESEKAKKQAEALRGAVTDLMLQIRFFGDESEVASTKQSLLRQGITDFDKGLGASAVGLAAYVDKLKAGQKATDEYNQKLKSAREELQKTRETADFDLKFPNPTALDKFNQWVKTTASNFRELKGEVELTAQKIRNLLISNAAKSRDSAINEFIKGIDELKQKEPVFDATLRSFLSSFDILPADLEKVLDYARTRITEFYEGLQKVRNDEERKFLKDMVYENAQRFLRQFKDSAGIQIFPENVQMFEKFIQLLNAISDNQTAEGLEKLSSIFDNLNLRIGEFGASTGLEKLRKELASPEITSAINAQAQALGYSAEQLKKIIELQYLGQSQQGATRPRIVPMPEDLSAWDSFFNTLKGKFDTFSTSIGSFSQNVSDVFTNALDGIGGAFTNALDSWLTQGESFFSAIGKSFAQLAQQIINELIRIAVIKLITQALGSAFGGGGFSPTNLGSGAGSAGHGLGLGDIFGAARGGLITGAGSPTSDSILARLSNGEFVMQAKAVKAFGSDFFHSLNQLRMPALAAGGGYGYMPSNYSTVSNDNRQITIPITVQGGGSGGRDMRSTDQIAREIATKVEMILARKRK